MRKLMIYGATGYTGRMAAQHAAAAGTPLVLAGRNEAALASLAASLGVEYRVFPLGDTMVVDHELRGVGVLLNCAGPFAATAEILMRAGMRNGVHYLDVAAELDGYRLAELLDADARAAGVMLLPGSGGSVAMLGCLAGHAVARSSNPSQIRVAMHVSGGLSRGSAVSAMASVTAETLARAGGKLVAATPGAIRQFDFGHGPVDCFQVTLPDLVTIWRATGVPGIEAFVHVTGEGFPQGELSALPDGPRRTGTAGQPLPGRGRGHRYRRRCRALGTRYGQWLHVHGDCRRRGWPARAGRRASSRLPDSGRIVRQWLCRHHRRHRHYRPLRTAMEKLVDTLMQATNAIDVSWLMATASAAWPVPPGLSHHVA